MCGTENSFLAMHGYSVVVLSPKGDQINWNGPTMPLVPIVCKVCGNTQFINPLIIGIGNNLFENETENGN
jgi:hypothetical protein